MNDATTNADARLLPTEKDVLTAVLHRGATQMLAQAIQAAVVGYLEARSHLRDDAGRQQVVRNGSLPQRTILTGIGPVEVKQPRVQDRRPPEQREKFSSAILPPYLRKTKSIEELIPWLYLKGISTGDFSEALAALLGPDAKGLSDFSTLSENPLQDALIDNTRSPVPDQVHFRIDFRSWLHTRTERDRRLVHDMAMGQGTSDLSRKFGLSAGRVSQMRQEFHDDWVRFTDGESVTTVAN